MSTNLLLIIWHKQLGHLNLLALWKHLQKLQISFHDNAKDFVYNSCQRAKSTKIYNRTSQKQSRIPFQFIYTNLVGLISLMRFSGERYFFTFTNDCTCYTKTYTGIKKSYWLNCLKTFHSLAKIHTKSKRPTGRICLDYGFEL